MIENGLHLVLDMNSATTNAASAPIMHPPNFTIIKHMPST
jgi:hypothetical protein